MAIFPSGAGGIDYYDENDRYIKQHMEYFYSQNAVNTTAYFAEADVDHRMYSGDQSLYADMYGVPNSSNRTSFVFNRIRRVVDMVSGYQRRNRSSTIVVPRENGDALTADQLTQVLLWAYEKEQVPHTISTAFQNAMISGMCLLHVWVDYRSDPISGTIKVDVCNYNSFMIDSYFQKPDLSDCNGIWKRSFVTRSEALSLLPEKEEEIMSVSSYIKQDGKFEFMPEYYGNSQDNLLTYDEFYYRTYRTQKMLVDRQTGEMIEWRGSDEDLKLFLQTFDTITVINSDIPTVNLAVVLQGRVLFDGANPSGTDRYPFVPVLGYFHPELAYYPWRIQGMVRGLRDSQYLYNRRMIIMGDILESQINSGHKYKVNALVNPKDIFLTGQGRGLALKEDAAMSDVERIPAPEIPPSMMQLSEILGNEITQISGANEELLGSAIDDKAGVLSMLRQGAGLTTLQTLFDQLEQSQRLLGSLAIDIIQSNFTPGKVERIVEQPVAPSFNNKMFGVYDAAIEEGFNTTTQKQMQFAQMIQLRSIGVPIPDEIMIESATLQNKPEIVQKMQQIQQQAQQQQEQQAQLQAAQIQSQIKLAESSANAADGLGLERISRIEENRALADERKAEALHDETSGLLDIIKALKEIDDIDLRQLEKLLSLSALVKEKVIEEPKTPSVPEGPVVDRGVDLAG